MRKSPRRWPKAAPLIDNPNTPAAIKVSGSHRDKAGVPEVHEKETDVFYVVRW